MTVNGEGAYLAWQKFFMGVIFPCLPVFHTLIKIYCDINVTSVQLTHQDHKSLPLDSTAVLCTAAAPHIWEASCSITDRHDGGSILRQAMTSLSVKHEVHLKIFISCHKESVPPFQRSTAMRSNCCVLKQVAHVG